MEALIRGGLRRNYSSVVVAIGVVSAPGNVERRDASRRTWQRHPSVGHALQVRFVVRLPPALNDRQRREIREEQNTNQDLLLLRTGLVAIAQDELHGRVLALHGWLRRAPRLFPSASWICKADDDAYIVPASFLHQLAHMQAEGLPPKDTSVLHGWLGWSAWNPKTFIPYVGSSFELNACEGKLGQPGWEDCVGPFPFVSGWLISMSAHLASRLAQSRVVRADVARMVKTLHRPWCVLEDIWLGYQLHNSTEFGGVSWVGAEHGNVFNGINAGRTFASPEKAHKTTYVYHHRDIMSAHLHASRAHTRPLPQLQCGRLGHGSNEDSVNDSPQTDLRSTGSSSRTAPGKSMAGWVRNLAGSFLAYAQSRKPIQTLTYCMLVDLT